jgi:hypothetical protein
VRELGRSCQALSTKSTIVPGVRATCPVAEALVVPGDDEGLPQAGFFKEKLPRFDLVEKYSGSFAIGLVQFFDTIFG